MTTQPEALRLANQLRDILPAFCTPSHERGVLNGAIQRLEQLHAECETLRFTRALAQARYENAVKLLTGIHELLYPAPVNTPDGRTLVFRPDDPDPHAILQLLSDRIRAIPAELEAARAAKEQSK